MMATTSHGRPGRPGGSVGTDDLSSSHSDSVHSGSLGDQDNSANGSIPESVDITVVLPNSTERQYTVDYQKQMMDLLVQVAVNNKLSPPSHKFHIINEETSRPVEFLASQSIGSLGCSLIYLVHKKADKKDTDIIVGQHELTKRFLVNLPRNQKTVIRVSMSISLAELYKMICAEKNLDPYKYELRHPTQPDEPLNMAAPLDSYGITEIIVVAVSGGGGGGGGGYRNSGSDTRRSTSALPDNSRTSSHSLDVGFSTVPRSTPSTATPAHASAMDSSKDYMPGMEKKKKKSILSFFQRKKGGKFNVCEATYASESQVAHSSISPPPTHTSTMTRSRTQPLSSEAVREQPSRPISSHSSHSSQGTSSQKPVPEKPPRKKRHAPPPPAAKIALQVHTEPTKPAEIDVTHSRTSSHSSGFDETTNSPLESPGNSSRESNNTKTVKKPGIALTSIESEDVISIERAGRMDGVQPRELTGQTSAMSVSSSDSTLPKTGKKKRKAPPPPGAQKPVVEAVIEQRPVTPPVDSAHSSPAHTANTTGESPNQPGGSTTQEAIIDEQLKTALVDELKKGPIEPSQGQGQNLAEGQGESDLQLSLEPPITKPDTPGDAHDEAANQSEPSTDHKPRLCKFVPPPPPESPPPPQSPNTAPSEYTEHSIEVMDSTTQVHVTTRDSLSSEYSCCVDSASSDDEDDLLNDLDLGSSGSSAVADLRLGDKEANEHVYITEPGKRKSDIAVFVEQMEELTEHAKKEEPVAEVEVEEGTDMVKMVTSEERVLSMEFADEENIVHDVYDSDRDELRTETRIETSHVTRAAGLGQDTQENQDSDSDVEALADMHSDGVVLLNKSDFSEYKAVSNVYVNPEEEQQAHSNVEVRHEMSTSFADTDEVSKSEQDFKPPVSTIRTSLHSEDSVSDSEQEGRREVTREEIKFAEEVMSAFNEPGFDDEVPGEYRHEYNNQTIEAHKKIIQPNFIDLSMEEEITFDFEQSDVMFVEPTPPKTSYKKEETSTKSSFNPDALPDPIIESTEYEEACEQFSEDINHAMTVEPDRLQEDVMALSTVISYNEPLPPAPEQFRQESPTEYFQQESSTGHFQRESPTEHFHQESHTEHFRQESPTNHFQQENSTEHFRQERTTEHFQQQSPTEHFQRESPTEHFQRESPTEHFRQESPTEHFRQESPTEQYQQESQPEQLKYRSPTEQFRHESPTEQIQKEISKPEIKNVHKPDKPRHESWHGNSITYMAPRNNNTQSDPNFFDDDGFKRPAMPLPKRKENHVTTPAPVPQPEEVKIKSLRDAYRKPETIIISKEKPLPVFEAKPNRVLPERRISEVPRQNVKETEDSQRRKTIATVPVDVGNPVPTEADKQRVSFWGPRPWSARAASEPSIRDVRMALAVAQEQNVDIEPDLNGDMNHNQKGSDAREQVSQIGYEPASAEEVDPMLEEKSISLSMPSLPGVQVERKPIYGGKYLNRYESSMGLLNSESSAPTNSSADATYTHKSSENINQKEKTKKSLHEQYGELEQQFGKWQMQLVENQKLLANRNIVPKEEGRALENLENVTAPPPPKEPIRRETSSFVTSAAKKEGRQSGSSSQSSGYGGLYDRFSPDELLAQKSLLQNNSNEELRTGTTFNGESSTIEKTRHSNVPAYTRSQSESKQITLGRVVPNPPKAESPVPPPAPAMVNPPPPPPVVKTWGTRVNAKKPQPQSKFGPQVSPREELMLAIRTAGGRNVLKKVPVNETNWYYNGPPSS